MKKITINALLIILGIVIGIGIGIGIAKSNIKMSSLTPSKASAVSELKLAALTLDETAAVAVLPGEVDLGATQLHNQASEKLQARVDNRLLKVVNGKQLQHMQLLRLANALNDLGTVHLDPQLDTLKVVDEANQSHRGGLDLVKLSTLKSLMLSNQLNHRVVDPTKQLNLANLLNLAQQVNNVRVELLS